MEGEIDLKQYVRVFWRRKWVFVFVFFGIIGFTALRLSISPKVYVAYSKVLIKKTSTLLGESKILEEAFGMDTNCEILRSRGFMELVADEMQSKDMKYWYLSTPALAPDIILQMTKITPLKESDLIQIEVQTNNNNEVADVVNSIAETFKNYSVKIARAKVIETRKFIENEIPVSKTNLEESERELQRFKEKEKLVSISAGGDELQEQLMQLQANYSELTAKIDTKKKESLYLEEILKKENEKLAERIIETDNPSLANLRDQLLLLAKERASYVIAGLSKDHPKLIELNEKIEKIKKDLRETVQKRSEDEILIVEPLSYPGELSKKILDARSEIYILSAQKEAMGERIKGMEARIEAFPSKEYEIKALERAFRFKESIYEKLMDRYEEAKLTEVGEIGNVVIVEKASVPAIPLSPKPRRDMIFGVIFALALGIASVIIKEFLDQSVKDVEDLEKLRVPTIGAIPFTHEPIVTDPLSLTAEAYKKIRVNLRFSKTGVSDLKTILVSSCVAKEGKTTVTTNLSLVSAKTGAKTIIVEADLRKPTLAHQLHSIKAWKPFPHSKVGLSDFLVGKAKLEDIIIQTDEENLFVILSGYIPPNPSELIDSEAMRSLLAELNRKFDAIFIDSPPLVSCADGFLLGTMVDGVIVVMELGKTQKEVLVQITSSFASTGASFLGVVPNRVKQPIYHRYPYYYKYYGAYRGDKGATKKA